jgi:hopanoid biosynthesis associated protein HpnK
MASPEVRGRRRLVVNADDFGRSHSINEAVIRAHREGILTTASLMVGGEAFEEAVELARKNPRLGVGLHLTLVCGRAVSPPDRIPGLVDGAGEFSSNPGLAGFRYWAERGLREPLRRELEAQFERFHQTGLVLDHVNGHLHLHLHPVVFGLLAENAAKWRIERMRLTRDSLAISRRTASGRWAYRLSHAVIFGVLSRRARATFARLGIRHTDRVFGLLQDGCVDEAFVERLLPCLPPGDNELYSHPSLDRFRPEFEALISPRVRDLVRRLGWELVRYQDL